MLLLVPDSSYAWVQSDSVALSRLLKITTTAPDGSTQNIPLPTKCLSTGSIFDHMGKQNG